MHMANAIAKDEKYALACESININHIFELDFLLCMQEKFLILLFEAIQTIAYSIPTSFQNRTVG